MLDETPENNRITDFLDCLWKVIPDETDIAEAADPLIDGWLESCKGNRIDAEMSANHVHIADVLSRIEYGKPISYSMCVRFARVYAAVLKDLLAAHHPYVPFIVKIYGDSDDSEDLLDIIVTYYRE